MSFGIAMMHEDVAKMFSGYFEIIFAHTEELKRKAYQIRYDVYCDELGFEDPAMFSDKLEKDECDDFSHHYLIRHRNSGLFAGTIRIVEPSLVPYPALCPIEQHCSDAITDKNYQPSLFRRNSFCEVSRLAVPNTFRRRVGEQGKPFIFEGERVSISMEEKKAFPFIAVGLYMCGAAHFVTEKQLDHIFVMMEPRLALHLRRVGIMFKRIGEVVDYHGKRAPYHVNEERLLSGMHPYMMDLYKSIEKEVVKQKHQRATLGIAKVG